MARPRPSEPMAPLVRERAKGQDFVCVSEHQVWFESSWTGPRHSRIPIRRVFRSAFAHEGDELISPDTCVGAPAYGCRARGLLVSAPGSRSWLPFLAPNRPWFRTARITQAQPDGVGLHPASRTSVRGGVSRNRPSGPSVRHVRHICHLRIETNSRCYVCWPTDSVSVQTHTCLLQICRSAPLP